MVSNRKIYAASTQYIYIYIYIYIYVCVCVCMCVCVCVCVCVCARAYKQNLVLNIYHEIHPYETKHIYTICRIQICHWNLDLRCYFFLCFFFNIWNIIRSKCKSCAHFESLEVRHAQPKCKRLELHMHSLLNSLCCILPLTSYCERLNVKILFFL